MIILLSYFSILDFKLILACIKVLLTTKNRNGNTCMRYSGFQLDKCSSNSLRNSYEYCFLSISKRLSLTFKYFKSKTVLYSFKNRYIYLSTFSFENKFYKTKFELVLRTKHDKFVILSQSFPSVSLG